MFCGLNIFAISTAQYRHGIFDFLLACAVDDEFVDRNEAVVVEIHRFEYSLHVQFGIIIPRSVPSHQLMDRVHNLLWDRKKNTIRHYSQLGNFAEVLFQF